jgi:hypothetical protein
MLYNMILDISFEIDTTSVLVNNKMRFKGTVQRDLRGVKSGINR